MQFLADNNYAINFSEEFSEFLHANLKDLDDTNFDQRLYITCIK